MTKLIVLSVFDSKTKEYTTPHYAKTKAEAIRSFMSACEDTNTNLNKYPSDFSLEHIGEFNSTSSTLTSKIPEQLAHASEFTSHLTETI